MVREHGQLHVEETDFMKEELDVQFAVAGLMVSEQDAIIETLTVGCFAPDQESL